ncbi:acyl-CoA dehydrogenase C-terminal domain-containing protein [Kordiimonas laminariae]|uniref:acyl-CoA dehydrogenase C-terminal domain-containing protein n=1 Tax=Kordiimonas laminariae TaxID=2917717 RepID=UPI001FF67B31|nr:acyl-CoA dehydrogenase C-terminal domain-containing protein [Kordiimonas laminariae]MCK0069222.1 acyl-CoA dehydrogenase C-terminal domain-containing protein [Kordiimonas laminariae]
MPSYKAPVKDMSFVLNEVLNLSQYSHLPGYDEATPDLISAILEEGAKLCENELAPLNLSGDQEGCHRAEDGSVTTPKGFKEAYAKYTEGGWPGLTENPDFGGQGMPHTLGFCLEEMMVSSNMAFAMYPGLTAGARAAINIDGTDEQKQTYLPKMISGEWTGTMNLTEPHCGTDLGMLRTKAEPNDDGSYAISGTKIFISAGEHDMADNIIHLVLARLPDAPKGVKGISLFIVPKFNLNEDGSVGEKNGVSCGSIEEKMGIHGNSTCVMNYDNAKGFLLGEPHKGLRSMFIMMNAARIGVAVQGYGLSEVAYQNAVEYAKDRIQGRALTGPKMPEKAADSIIVHPDVRRNLMNARSFNEAARAAAMWCALLVDVSHNEPDEEKRQWADDIVGLLTPVMKGVFTDRGFEYCASSQQVFGGHGYISEWGMEQFVRDARITQIYEGANGIQALDLVGRKLPANGGRGIQAFFSYVGKFLSANKENEKLADFVKPLSKALTDLQTATMWLVQNGMANPDNAGAASTPYMHLFGHVLLGFQWAQIAKIATEQLDAGTSDPTFYENKLITGRYYMNRRMPETAALLGELQTGAEDVMALDAANF